MRKNGVDLVIASAKGEREKITWDFVFPIKPETVQTPGDDFLIDHFVIIWRKWIVIDHLLGHAWEGDMSLNGLMLLILSASCWAGQVSQSISQSESTQGLNYY